MKYYYCVRQRKFIDSTSFSHWAFSLVETKSKRKTIRVSISLLLFNFIVHSSSYSQKEKEKKRRKRIKKEIKGKRERENFTKNFSFLRHKFIFHANLIFYGMFDNRWVARSIVGGGLCQGLGIGSFFAYHTRYLRLTLKPIPDIDTNPWFSHAAVITAN